MITKHGICIKSAEEQLRELDGDIEKKLDEIRGLLKTRADCDRINIAGWELRDMFKRRNLVLNRLRLEGGSEKEYYAHLRAED